MNKNTQEVRSFFENLEDLSSHSNNVDYGVAPTALTMLTASEANVDSNFIIAAQDAHFEPNGAYTGNVSYKHLSDEGYSFAIVGHSERRAMFHDTDLIVNQKVNALLNHNMVPVLCCGETLEEYEAGNTVAVVKKQLITNLKGIDRSKAHRIIVAYEPIWSIGTGKAANPEIAQNTCKSVREVIATLLGQETADKVRILYGGSVKPENVKSYLGKEDIDGALVGGASLQPESFASLIKNIA